MSETITFNTSNGSFITKDEYSEVWNIQELKDAGVWEKKRYVSAEGLVEEVKKLGQKGLVGLEIGIASGWNMDYFLEEIPGLILTGVDPYEPYQDTHRFISEEIVNSQYIATLSNMKKYGLRAIVIKDKSENIVDKFEDNSLDYIFIDGEHSYEAVLRDCINFYRKVRSGGIFSGHDFHLIEVQKALSEFRENNTMPEIKRTHNQVWYWIKP